MRTTGRAAQTAVPLAVFLSVVALAVTIWATARDPGTRTTAVSLGIAALSFLGAYLGVRWTAQSAQAVERRAGEARFAAAVEVLREISVRYRDTAEEMRRTTDAGMRRSLADEVEARRLEWTAAKVQALSAGALLHHGSDAGMSHMRAQVDGAAQGEVVA